MSAFTHNFNLGFFHGMFNGMFGGFGAFNWGCLNFRPSFFAPSYNLDSIIGYQSPVTMGASIFSYNDSSLLGLDFNTTPQYFDYSTPINTGMSWQNYDYSASQFQTSYYDMGESFDFSRKKSPKKDKADDKPIDYNAEKLRDKWQATVGRKLSNEFYTRIVKLAKEINCDPNDLMAVIRIETAGSFSPSKQNPKTRATGLIQFMPTTAKGYGTSVEALARMTIEEQMDYVERHFKDGIKHRKISGRLDAATVYALVFWPAAASKSDNYVIATRGATTYRQNSGLDIDNNGFITKGDLGKWVALKRA